MFSNMEKMAMACLLFFCAVAYASPGLEEIVGKALEQDERLRQQQKIYEYDLTVVTEKMDRDNQIFETDKAQAVEQLGKEIEYKIEDTDDKRIKESKKIMSVMNLKKLAPRFSLSLDNDEIVNSISCYVVRFDPKPDQPYDSREEKVVNKLAGKFWISKNDFSIVKSEGTLTEPVSVAWIFATMREVHFVYQAAPLPDNELAPSSFDLLYDLQTTIGYRRRKQYSTMLNYRLAGANP